MEALATSRSAGFFTERASLLSAMAGDATLAAIVDRVVAASVRTLRAGGKILFMGNGGSAGEAQHLAADLVSRFAYDRPGLAGLALTTDTSALTAIGNDYGFERLFARQIEALGRPGDVVFGLTTSGQSPNILAGFEAARVIGMVTVGMTRQGADLAQACDHRIEIAATSTPVIQEGHLIVGHLICMLIEEQLFPKTS